MSSMAPPRAGAGLARLAALGGIAYVVLFMVGVILFSAAAGREPGAGEDHRLVLRFGAPGADQHRWLVAGLGVFFFLWFLSALRRTVRRLEGDDGFLTALTTIGGTVYAALSLAALAVKHGIKTMSDDTYQHQVFPGLIHAADNAGLGAARLGRGRGHHHGGSGDSHRLLAELSARAVPGLGWLARGRRGILSLALIVFFPWFLFAMGLVVSIGMFLAQGASAGAAV